ncbi:PREDICTED: protein CHROMATIN REMODELING 24 [Camelina sativa]|uniref:Protein CHROMATIN REMODELING 24 n=1 Tax=Camelina sativa TaxID=90675 RepID=A0ABM0VP73_CAMSA|nr:PREDICTED: protein CHROMATIN REMODELING 24 [Camelina sativa]
MKKKTSREKKLLGSSRDDEEQRVYEGNIDRSMAFIPEKSNSGKTKFGPVKIKKPVKTKLPRSQDITFTGSGSGSNVLYTLPGNIATKLYPHQREGLKWLWSLHIKENGGGILADDMGLGKTFQMASFLSGLFQSKLVGRVLLVAPITLHPQWIYELDRVGLKELTKEYHGTSRKAREQNLNHVLQGQGVLITTYDMVRCHTKALQGTKWDYMILDEGQAIKNPETQRTKSLHEIPSSHRIVITGTPLENKLEEIWELFNFTCPGLLGDKKSFKQRFQDHIVKQSYKSSSLKEQSKGSTVAKIFREEIQPVLLRRLKKDVFGDDAGTSRLPNKHELVIWLRLTTCQRQLYEDFLKRNIVLSDFDSTSVAALTILQKICNHPLLLPKETVFTSEEAGMSCKLAFLISLLGQLIPEGHRVLIFSHWSQMLNLIEESLTSNNFSYLRIDGGQKPSQRLKTITDFQVGCVAPIFLLTSQIGGVGLTLTTADRVIVLDPSWNPSMDNQIIDRAYRIGQKNDVVVYRLITSGTVEEKVYRKQVFKSTLFKTVTEDKELFRYFSEKDLKEVFIITKGGFDVSATQQMLYKEDCKQIKLDETLESHVKFLETLGIAGVSHHSLLFSKTPPVRAMQKYEEEEIRRGTTSSLGNRSSTISQDIVINGADYAHKPKDVIYANLLNKTVNSSPVEEEEFSQSYIKERIRHYSYLFKCVKDDIGDKGAKIQTEIDKWTRLLKPPPPPPKEQEMVAPPPPHRPGPIASSSRVAATGLAFPPPPPVAPPLPPGPPPVAPPLPPGPPPCST